MNMFSKHKRKNKKTGDQKNQENCELEPISVAGDSYALPTTVSHSFIHSCLIFIIHLCLFVFFMLKKTILHVKRQTPVVLYNSLATDRKTVVSLSVATSKVQLLDSVRTKQTNMNEPKKQTNMNEPKKQTYKHCISH